MTTISIKSGILLNVSLLKLKDFLEFQPVMINRKNNIGQLLLSRHAWFGGNNNLETASKS